MHSVWAVIRTGRDSEAGEASGMVILSSGPRALGPISISAVGSGRVVASPWYPGGMPADLAEIERLLDASLDDDRLSRAERRTLDALLEDVDDPDQRLLLLERAFRLFGERLSRPSDRARLAWLHTVTKRLGRRPPAAAPESTLAQVYFAPRDDCAARIVDRITSARRSFEACVFTITDDRLSRALLAAHRRGVAVRVISDDDKSLDRGSDIARLAGEGVPVALDRTAEHMHHKFALADRRVALTGSYNWTRSASERNRENVVVTDDRRLVERFADAFDLLWRELRDR